MARYLMILLVTIVSSFSYAANFECDGLWNWTHGGMAKVKMTFASLNNGQRDVQLLFNGEILYSGKASQNQRNISVNLFNNTLKNPDLRNIKGDGYFKPEYTPEVPLVLEGTNYTAFFLCPFP